MDTEEFLATDTESDDEEEDGTEHLETSINSTNFNTTPYLLDLPPTLGISMYGSWWFVQSFLQTWFTLLSVAPAFFQGSYVSSLQILTQIWYLLSVSLLFFSALGWDTLYLYLDPSSPIPSTTSRK